MSLELLEQKYLNGELSDDDFREQYRNFLRTGETAVATEEPRQPLAPADRPGVLGAIMEPVAGLASGVVSQAPSTIGRALRTLDPEGGTDIIRDAATATIEWAESMPEKYKFLRPSKQSQDSYLRRSFYGGLQALPTSILAGVPGAAVGMAGGPMGAVGGFAASGGTVFGLAEYDRFVEEAIQQGLEPSIAHSGAVKAAFTEGGLEAVNNLVGLLTLKVGSAAMQPFKRTIKEMTKQGIGTATARLGGMVGIEAGTEMAQEAAGAAIRQDVGMETVDPWVAAKEAIGPAVVMSLLFGGGAQGFSALRRAEMRKTLADENADPEKRAAVANAIGQELHQTAPEFADRWMSETASMIDQGLPVYMDEDLSRIDDAIALDDEVHARINERIEDGDLTGAQEIAETFEENVNARSTPNVGTTAPIAGAEFPVTLAPSRQIEGEVSAPGVLVGSEGLEEKPLATEEEVADIEATPMQERKYQKPEVSGPRPLPEGTRATVRGMPEYGPMTVGKTDGGVTELTTDKGVRLKVPVEQTEGLEAPTSYQERADADTQTAETPDVVAEEATEGETKAEEEALSEQEQADLIYAKDLMVRNEKLKTDDIKKTKLHKEKEYSNHQKTIADGNKKRGRRTIFVKGSPVNGVNADPGVIVVDITSDRGIAQTTGHELKHSFEKDKNVDTMAYNKTLVRAITRHDGLRRQWHRFMMDQAPGKRTAKEEMKLWDEFGADFMGDVFADKGQAVAYLESLQKSPATFTKVKKAIRGMLTSFGMKPPTPETPKTLADAIAETEKLLGAERPMATGKGKEASFQYVGKRDDIRFQERLPKPVKSAPVATKLLDARLIYHNGTAYGKRGMEHAKVAGSKSILNRHLNTGVVRIIATPAEANVEVRSMPNAEQMKTLRDMVFQAKALTIDAFDQKTKKTKVFTGHTALRDMREFYEGKPERYVSPHAAFRESGVSFQKRVDKKGGRDNIIGRRKVDAKGQEGGRIRKLAAEVFPSRRGRAKEESVTQVGILRKNQHTTQEIVTIADAKGWLLQRGFKLPPPKGTIDQQLQDLLAREDFNDLSIFDKIRLAAQLERGDRKTDYKSLVSLAGVGNRKTREILKIDGKEYTIIPGDTIRGCDQFCHDCYALKGAEQASINHQNPIASELTGEIKENEIFRAGTVGEPAKDWAHTHNQIQGMIDRSRAKGRDVSADKNVYYITKLLNIDGFNPDTARNLEISMDPLYPSHMRQTMANVLRIKARHPEVNMALRIRTVATGNPYLQEVQDVAVEFANRYNLPILETRMRFRRKHSLNILELDEDAYKRVGPQLKLKSPQISKKDSKRWYLCDEKDTGVCGHCKNCHKLMFGQRDQQLRDQVAGLEKNGITGKAVSGFPTSIDVKGPSFQVRATQWYSRLEEKVEAMPDKIEVRQLPGLLKTGVDKEEIAWTGFGDFVDDLQDGEVRFVKKADLLDFLRENQVDVREEVFSEIAEDELFLIQTEADHAERRGEKDKADRLRKTIADRKTRTPRNSDYTLPGGTNHREIVIYSMKAEPMDESRGHYGDVGSGHVPFAEWLRAEHDRDADHLTEDEYVEFKEDYDGDLQYSRAEGGRAIGYIRVNDRTGPNGERILHIDNLQSPRHQRGAKEGYRDKDAPQPKIKQDGGRFYVVFPWAAASGTKESDLIRWNTREEAEDHAASETRKRESASMMRNPELGTTPPAPWKGDRWVDLLMRRAIIQAVEGGYDAVTWTTGQQQMDRWGASNRGLIDIYDSKIPKSAKRVTKKWKGRVGKTQLDMTQELSSDDKAEMGLELTYGVGEGAEIHHDKDKGGWVLIDVNGEHIRDEYGGIYTFDSKEDARSALGQETKVREGFAVHSLQITDAMRESVKSKGMPKFQERGTRRAREARVDNAEIERRLTKAWGVPKDTLRSRLRAALSKTMASWRRHFVHLDPKRHALAADILRQWESAQPWAKEKAIRDILEIVKPLGKEGSPEWTAFERTIILSDLKRDVDKGELYEEGAELPFGYKNDEQGRAQLNSHLQKYLDMAKANPVIGKALEQRKKMMQDLRVELVEEGLLHKDVLKDPAYFHHQVLEYMDMLGLGIKGQDMKQRQQGWQKGRTGSSRDYNTRYMESEIEVVAQGRALLELKKAHRLLNSAYNLAPQLRKQAKETGAKSWKSLIPEGHTIWTPKYGSAFATAHTIPERLVNKAMADGMVEVAAGKIKENRIRVPGEEWVIPQELADQLDDMTPMKDEGPVANASRRILTSWKQWVLINPVRVIKYNMNNMSGDFDIAFAYNPKIIGHMWKAYSDLRKHVKGTKLSDDIIEATRGGVIGGGLSAHEIPDIEKEAFLGVISGNKINLVRKYWDTAKGLTNLRENILRLAAYRHFKGELAKGKRDLYGASRKDEIDQIYKTGDMDRVAAKLARELIGDYGNTSLSGQWMARHMIPFYRWMEVNAPRYVRLMHNLPAEGRRGGLVRTAAVKTPTLALKMSFLYIMVNLWNHMMFPDDEEEYGEFGRRQLHLLLGRREDGTIRSIRFQGALSDALDWFGFGDLPADVKDVMQGEATPADKAKEAANAGWKKMVVASRPFMRTAYEMFSGKSYWPDPMKPRSIRDRKEHALRMLSLDKAYRVATNRPHRGMRELTGSIFYSTDPSEAAYMDIRSKGYKYMEDIGKPPPSVQHRPGSPGAKRSNALYYYKLSLRYGKPQQAKYWMERYMAEGGTKQGMATSLRWAHPLAGVPKKYRSKFLAQLTEKEKKQLKIAEQYYNEIYRGR